MADLGDCDDTEKDNAGSWEGFISMEPGCVNIHYTIKIDSYIFIFDVFFM